MVTPKEQQIAAQYIDMMVEIRDRVQAASRSQTRELSEPLFQFEYMAAEFGMLQLRMICELIALACVVAHGDLPVTRSPKFAKDYSADRIFRKLQDYHSDFFPTPAKIVDLGGGAVRLEEEKPDAITRTELERLYRYCHDRLHRGRAEEILSGKRRLYDYAYINESGHKLTWLLDSHVISFAKRDHKAWVQFRPNGKVRWDWLLSTPPE